MRLCLLIILIGLSPALSLSAAGSTTPSETIPRALALDDYLIQNWTTDDGLLHTHINQIIQDHTGFIWLATGGGLGRFDGRAFKNFIPPAGLQKGGLNIRGVAETKEGALLLLVSRGQILQFHRNTFSLHPLSFEYVGKAWADIFSDQEGATWVGATDGTLVRWQGGKSIVFGRENGIDRRSPRFSFAVDETGKTWIASGRFVGYYENGKLIPVGDSIGHVISLCRAHAGGMWIIADGQLARWVNGHYSIVMDDPPWLKAEASIRCLFEDSRGSLWIGATHRGLFRYSNGTCTRISYPYDSVNYVTEDTEGGVWVGTDGDGLSLLKPKYFRRYDVSAGLQENLSSSVCEDAAGDIWFGNGKGGLWRKHGEEVTEISSMEAYEVSAHSDGTIWIGTSDGVYQLNRDNPSTLKKTPAPIRQVRIVFPTKGGDVWVAGTRNELGVITGDTFASLNSDEAIAHDHVNAITEDTRGNVWLGTGLGSLLVSKGGRLVRSTPSQNEMTGAPIHALWADEANSLWIGTSNGLLLKTDTLSKRFDESNGLIDSMIFQIIPDDVGHVWFGSRRGLFYISKAELKLLAEGKIDRVNAHTFGRDEGLPGVSMLTSSQPTVAKDRSGKLWFATHQGVIEINPASFPKVGAPPPVLIDDVSIDERVIPTYSPIVIPPGNHRVEFRLCAVSFGAPSKIRLRHQLEGADPSWVETTIARSASYASLPPGSYHLKVEACNENGQWGTAGTALAVTVLPAWWQTTWFRASALAALMIAVAGVVRYWSEIKLRQRLERLERAHALEKERARIARDVHDELGSSVTGLRLLVNRLREDASEHERGTVVEQLSGRTQRLAFDLERVVWSVSPKNSRLDKLAAFVGRFAQNFVRGAPIECAVLRSATIPALPIPPDFQHHILAVTKEAINNVLKHSKATAVTIEIGFKDHRFELTISDNGIGFEPDAEEHAERNGLSNMRSRISEIGGKIEIHSRKEGGTKIIISAPMLEPKS